VHAHVCEFVCVKKFTHIDTITSKMLYVDTCRHPTPHTHMHTSTDKDTKIYTQTHPLRHIYIQDDIDRQAKGDSGRKAYT
jgi:hypothetical protein